MIASLPLFGALLLFSTLPIETTFVQVSPEPRVPTTMRRSQKQTRAVLLIHGFRLHPFNSENVGRANVDAWQKSDSSMVKALGKDSDVYAFTYGQNGTVEQVAGGPDLAAGIRRLRELGYTEIVLVGHSAGGLIARLFVEDCPDAGVTKVIQICPVNGGSLWTKAKLGIRETQGPFAESLSTDMRILSQKLRSDRRIPSNVEFVCVVGTGSLVGDGVVLSRGQWTPDLQAQGIPMVTLLSGHHFSVRTPLGANLVATLVREPQPRWDAKRVAAARKSLFGPP